jgi:hypothetical protein
MKSWHINRRDVLRGLGVSVALPFLEGMTLATENKKPTPRMCFNYFHYGVPMPRDDHPDRQKHGWFPTGAGKEFNITGTHKSLEPFKKKLTYFGGLSHPLGRRVPGHKGGDVYLTGADISGSKYRQSISIDQVAANAIGDQTRFSSLVFSSAGGVNRPYRSHTLSYDKDGRPIPSEHRPKEIFQRLFGTEDASSKKAIRNSLDNQASILDTILEEASSLESRLGSRDQQKLDEYLSSVREVEKRVVRAQDWLDIQKPKVDPSEVNLDANPEDAKEFLRSKYDLILLAFQTDSSRIATYQTAGETGLGPERQYPLAAGINKDSHKVSHEKQNYEQWSKYSQFLVEQHAYFLDRLGSIQEGEGTLLDHTMVLYGSCTSSTHLTRNYPLVLAGGSNLGIQHGQYRKYSENVPLSNLFVTLLDRMNVPVPAFKDSTGDFSEILKA